MPEICRALKGSESVKFLSGGNMNMRLFDVSLLTPTGGSYRTTVPVSVVRDLWKIERREVAVCFLEENGRVFLIPFDELLEGDFPKEIKRRAIERWSRKVLGSTVHRRFRKNIEKLARGELTGLQFMDELKRDLSALDEKVKPYVGKLTGSLAFATETESLLFSAVAVYSEFVSQELGTVLEVVRELIEEREWLGKMLESLRQRGDIPEDLRDLIGGRMEFELGEVENAIERIKAAVCR